MNTLVERITNQKDLLIAIGVVGILGMIIIPLPPPVLDLFFATNISLSVVILLLTMYIKKPLDLSVFPSLLLITTLFRLALNISSTRSILLHAYAGKIIDTFGKFVVGGNYVVGMVVFLIIVIIQFVVITNGAQRVAEVAARFTLDAMPGKQMSIDADLNAGLIDEAEARRRREEITKEANFYGAMDGASKFVRGDAIAGIIITFINIMAGVIIGVMQLGMPADEALKRYALLTVGDGLVAQIPALIISTATGILVTRASAESNLGVDLGNQFTSNPRILALLSFILFGLALVPGLPKFPFFFLSALSGFTSYALQREELVKEEEEAKRELEEEEEAKPPPQEEETVESFLQVDPMELEIGYSLISIVDPEQGGDLLNRITMVRKQIAMDLGIIVPPIRIRDNVQLKPNTYQIKIRGVKIAEGEVMPGYYLAMNPGTAEKKITGIETKEPAFGLPALWIKEEDREEAELAGYTVVDPTSVISTHLTEVIKRYAHELLTREDVKRLVDNVKKNYPAVVDELIPDVMTIGEVQKVLKNLLREQVSIRDMVTILETLGDYAPQVKDIDLLTEYVRVALSRSIVSRYLDENGELWIITLDPELEKKIADSIQRTEEGSYLALEPRFAQKFLQSLSKEMERASSTGHQPVLVCAPNLRRYIKLFTERVLPNLVVLSYNEISTDINLKTVGMVRVS